MGKEGQIYDKAWKLDFLVVSMQWSIEILNFNCIPEIYIMLLNNVTSIKFF